MRTNLVTAATAMALAVPGAAQATAEHGYTGGCHFAETTYLVNPAPPQRHGEVELVVVPTDADGVPAPDTAFHAECILLVNGEPSTTLLKVSPGRYFFIGSKGFYFTADDADVLTVCENVTVGNDSYSTCPAG